jgi:hypothetical protein
VHLDHLRLAVAHLHPHTAARRRDRQLLIAELAHDVERLLRRPLMRETQRVRRDVLLDRRSHLRRRLEEAIRRHHAIEPLMRPLEIVSLHEQREPLFAVHEVVKHRL